VPQIGKRVQDANIGGDSMITYNNFVHRHAQQRHAVSAHRR